MEKLIKFDRIDFTDIFNEIEEENTKPTKEEKPKMEKPKVEPKFVDLSNIFGGSATYEQDKQLLVNYINNGGTFDTKTDTSFFISLAKNCNWNEKVMYCYGVNSEYYNNKSIEEQNEWSIKDKIVRNIKEGINISKILSCDASPFAVMDMLPIEASTDQEKIEIIKIEKDIEVIEEKIEKVEEVEEKREEEKIMITKEEVSIEMVEPVLMPTEEIINQTPINPVKEVLAQAKSKPKNKVNLVEVLVGKIKKKYRIIYYIGAFYLYEDGWYERTSEERFLGFIKNELSYENKEPALVRNIYASLKMELDIFIEEKKNNIDPRIEPKDWICFKNCLYNPFTKETKSHTPDLIFFSRIPYNYNPNAKEHQLTMDMFDNFTKGYSESSKELFLELLYQTIGVTLSSIRPKNFFFFSGLKDTGKSTICGLIQKLIGLDNCSAVPIELISESGFYLSTMIGKKANISPETANVPLRENQINLLKKITGGDNDLVYINIKGVTAQEVVLRTMLIFGGNNLPDIWGNGDMEAFVKRMINVSFRGQIKEEDKIHNLLDIIDYEYIIRMAMEALTRFIDNNHVFTVPPEVEENRQRMLNADPVSGFLELCDLSDTTYKISGKKLYECFMLFKERNSYSDNITSNLFTSKLKVKGYEKKSVRVDKTEGILNPIKGFVGIKPPAEYSDVAPMVLPFNQLASKQ